MVNALSARDMDPSFRQVPIIVTLKRTVYIYLYNSKLYKTDDVFAQMQIDQDEFEEAYAELNRKPSIVLKRDENDLWIHRWLRR
jgi:hypothetical protein